MDTILKQTTRLTASVVAVFFSCNMVFAPVSYAQVAFLPEIGSMVSMTSKFDPMLVKGIKLYPDNPFKFDFIVDTGDMQLSQNEIKDQGQKLASYFLASLTTPEKEMWVNLSPYEKSRIIPNGFGDTQMGQELLSEDYLLKQIMATALYPEREIGKEFWQKVYDQAAREFGTTNIPVNTFNKVWILPDEAVVYENAQMNSVFVVQSRLKVMLEQDYLAANKAKAAEQFGFDVEALTKSSKDEQAVASMSSKIIKQVVIPALEKEVNEGKNFAGLRQVYQSLILAAWYKKNLKNNVLSKGYVDRGKTLGVDTEDKQITEKIYQQYLRAYRKGVYNYIKEEMDPTTNQVIPRKYFSGGMGMMNVSKNLAMASSVQASRFNTGALASIARGTLLSLAVALIVAVASPAFAGSIQGAVAPDVQTQKVLGYAVVSVLPDQIQVALSPTQTNMNNLIATQLNEGSKGWVKVGAKGSVVKAVVQAGAVSVLHTDKTSTQIDLTNAHAFTPQVGDVLVIQVRSVQGSQLTEPAKQPAGGIIKVFESVPAAGATPPPNQVESVGLVGTTIANIGVYPVVKDSTGVLKISSEALKTYPNLSESILGMFTIRIDDPQAKNVFRLAGNPSEADLTVGLAKEAALKALKKWIETYNDGTSIILPGPAERISGTSRTVNNSIASTQAEQRGRSPTLTTWSISLDPRFTNGVVAPVRVVNPKVQVVPALPVVKIVALPVHLQGQIPELVKFLDDYEKAGKKVSPEMVDASIKALKSWDALSQYVGNLTVEASNLIPRIAGALAALEAQKRTDSQLARVNAPSKPLPSSTSAAPATQVTVGAADQIQGYISSILDLQRRIALAPVDPTEIRTFNTNLRGWENYITAQVSDQNLRTQLLGQVHAVNNLIYFHYNTGGFRAVQKYNETQAAARARAALPDVAKFFSDLHRSLSRNVAGQPWRDGRSGQGPGPGSYNSFAMIAPTVDLAVTSLPDLDLKGGIDLEKVVVESRGSGVKSAFNDPKILKMLLEAKGLFPQIKSIAPVTIPMVNMLLGMNNAVPANDNNPASGKPGQDNKASYLKAAFLDSRKRSVISS